MPLVVLVPLAALAVATAAAVVATRRLQAAQGDVDAAVRALADRPPLDDRLR